MTQNLRARPRRRLALSRLVGAALISSLPAQQFAELSARAIQEEGPFSPGVPVLVDVDGDGDLDVVVPAVQGQTRLYINDGEGVYRDETAQRLPVDPAWTADVVAADVDGDGDADLILGRSSGSLTVGSQDRMYVNDGLGVFRDETAARLPTDTAKTTAIAVGDVDADGDLDLVLGNGGSGGRGRPDRLYLNDGFGVFADRSAQLPRDGLQTDRVSLADIDGDGDLDCLIGALFTIDPIRLYLNDGSARFVLAPGNAGLSRPRSAAYDTRLIDLESDGDPDIVALASNALVVFVNDGAGRFVEETSARVPGGFRQPVAVADFDGDLDFDVVTQGVGVVELLANDGGGRFVAQPLGPETVGLVVAGDIDADGDADLVAFEREGQEVHLNDGRGVFLDVRRLERRSPVIDGPVTDAVLRDFDRDGDFDLAITRRDSGSSATILVNDGRGFFGPAIALPGIVGPTSVIEAIDVDRDLDQDLVVGSSSSTVGSLLLLNVSGQFVAAAANIPGPGGQTTSLAVLDADGDGDADLVEGNFFDSSRLLLNDGAGRFVPSALFPTDTDSTRQLAVADIDADGDPDVLFGNGGVTGARGRPFGIYTNNGAGGFSDVTAANAPRDSFEAWDLAAFDCDGDGDIDVAFASTAGDRLYVNDGSGRFQDATGRLGPSRTSSTRIRALPAGADFDLAVSFDGTTTYLVNDGAGNFSRALTLESGDLLAVSDVDADDDLDLLLGTEGAPIRVATNLLNQLHFDRLLRVGRDAAFTIYREGAAASNGGAQFLASLREGLSRVPGVSGALGLGGANLLVGVAVPLPAGATRVRTPFAVPSLSGLVGVPLYVQALVADTRGLRLTNACAHVFVQ